MLRPSETVSAPADQPNSVQTILGIRTCDCGIQGPENLILAMADRLARRGVRYINVSIWDGEPPATELHDEMTKRGFESYVAEASFGMSPSFVTQISRLIRELNPDVVMTHDTKAEFATVLPAHFHRKPLIGSFYGRLAMSSLLLKAADRAQFGLFRTYDRVMANSAVQHAELLRYGVPEARVELVPSFVDGERLEPPSADERAAARKTLDIEGSRPVLATLARLSRNKGHIYMLRALKAICEEFPETLYLIPGEGDSDWRGEGGLRGELESEAAALGLSENVRLLGYYPDVRIILHATDLLVSPSLLEGMQVALLEAMATGLPIVGTRVGGTPEAVEEGTNGLLVPPADHESISQAVLSLLRDPERMKAMGIAARARLEERYEAQGVADQMLRICREVV